LEEGILFDQAISMKIRIVGTLIRDSEGSFSFPIQIDSDAKARTVTVKLDPESYDPLSPEPITFDHDQNDGVWVFRGRVILVEGAEAFPRNEVMVRIKHTTLREEQTFARMKHELEAFENMQRLPDAKREEIPESVRLFVWQRDEGKCVRCGSPEKLEFDHIIPVAKGGANTERNIHILCEHCNREKGAKI